MKKATNSAASGFRKLNSISEDRLKQTLNWSLNLLSEIERDKPDLVDSIGEMAMECGLYSYGLAESDSVVSAYFRKAATNLIKDFSTRQVPGELACLHLLGSELSLCVIFCFGTAEEKKICALLLEHQLAFTSKKIKFKSTGTDLPHIEWVMIFKDIIAGLPIDFKKIQDLKERSEKVKLCVDSDHLMHAFTFMHALENKSMDTMIQCLQEINDQHKSVAKRGNYRLRPQGLICLHALALYKLALDNGIKLDFESDYVPISLLGVATNNFNIQ